MQATGATPWRENPTAASAVGRQSQFELRGGEHAVVTLPSPAAAGCHTDPLAETEVVVNVTVLTLSLIAVNWSVHLPWVVDVEQVPPGVEPLPPSDHVPVIDAPITPLLLASTIVNVTVTVHWLFESFWTTT
jgi:hypothetical protein